MTVKVVVVLVFFTVTVFVALLIPACWLPNAKLPGVNATWDLTDPEPLPDKPTGCVPGKASVETDIAPGANAATVGWNLT